MKRTNVVRVLPTKEQKRILETVGDRAAALWNAVQYRCRQAFLAGSPVPSYEVLCSEFKEHPGYRALPAHIGQELIKKARKAWDSFFALLRLWRKGKLNERPGLPRYWKDRRTGKRFIKLIPVKAPTSYSLDARHLSLALPQDLREKRGERLILATRGVLRFHGTPKTLELKHDPVKRRWYAHQVVEVPELERKPRLKRCAAIDLGARVLVALAVEGISRQVLFSAREVWKDFLYWTKQISSEQSRLSKAGRKTSRKLRKLYLRRAQRLRHAFIALAAEVARIEAACTRAGIKVVPVEPRGTSSRCASCGSPVKRPVRHKAACSKCGRVWHADANAALNILLQGPSKGHGAEATPRRPQVLRWNRHTWSSRRESAAGTPKAASGVLEAA